MTSPKFFFCLTCLFLGKLGDNFIQSTTVHQDTAFISANVGDNLTLRCFYDSDAVKYYWYKQTLGQKLQPISNTYKFDKSGNFHDEFKDNPRFTLETNAGMNHLKISDVQPSDSATYYCARDYLFMFEFAEGTIVSVKGSGLNIQALVHQSESETIQPGGSVTLNCTVHTGTCDGEHSVYWFKSSEESHPGLIYTHGDRNDQCERKPNTQTHTCVYNLPMKNLNLSHAGTYYCAVASCGHILFGNGTKLDIEDEDSPVSVHFLGGAVTFTTILSVLLAFSVCVINNGRSCLSIHFLRFSFPSWIDSQNEDNLYYNVVRENKINRRRRQKDDTCSECVYFSVRQ
uniref:Ig-like domain-containing protein n=1 Tax=Lates calcarifer TaxID=8187 RepID=A0A4W6CWX7_LATCA